MPLRRRIRWESAHLWSVDYVKLLWSDTGAVLTAPAHWNEMDWMCAGFAAAGIGAAASLDNAIKDIVQAHRTAGQDRFLNQYQNLGAAWSFGVIGAFEIWGEVGGNTTAKNTRDGRLDGEHHRSRLDPHIAEICRRSGAPEYGCQRLSIQAVQQ